MSRIASPPSTSVPDESAASAVPIPPGAASGGAAGGVTPTGEPVFVRFRDRVRARVGSADVVVARIGHERFAFDLRAVEEVIEECEVLARPEVAAPFAGVVRRDGRALAVFDAGTMLGVGPARSCTVLVMRRGSGRVGLLVDEVLDVVAVDLAALLEAPFGAADDIVIGIDWRDDILTSLLDARVLVALCTLTATDAP